MARPPAVEPLRAVDVTQVNARLAAIRARLNKLDDLVDSAISANGSAKTERDITTLTSSVNVLASNLKLLKLQVEALQSSSGTGSTVINIMAFDGPEPEDAFFGM
jgi:hypothetical protein